MSNAPMREHLFKSYLDRLGSDHWGRIFRKRNGKPRGYHTAHSPYGVHPDDDPDHIIWPNIGRETSADHIIEMQKWRNFKEPPEYIDENNPTYRTMQRRRSKCRSSEQGSS